MSNHIHGEEGLNTLASVATEAAAAAARATVVATPITTRIVTPVASNHHVISPTVSYSLPHAHGVLTLVGIHEKDVQTDTILLIRELIIQIGNLPDAPNKHAFISRLRSVCIQSNILNSLEQLDRINHAVADNIVEVVASRQEKRKRLRDA